MGNLKDLLFKQLYTSLLFQLPFLGVIVFAIYDIVKNFIETDDIIGGDFWVDLWYCVIAVIYFVFTYLPNKEYYQKKLAARLCIYALCLTYFIYQTFIK